MSDRGAGMSEERLRTLLREEPIPGAAEAECRGLELIDRAYAERHPGQRPVLPRLAIAFAVAALLAALILSPAGAAVRDWVGGVFTAGVKNAEPALTGVPGGGDLLVQSSRGPWVVHPDGSRRLLGDYDEATWSPHGLFVAAASGRSLSAIEPDGTPHWSITAPGRVSEPRWSPSGFRIAYRAGHSLRVVRADGSGGTLVAASSAAVAPAWYPPGPHLLAFVDAQRRLVLAEADNGKTIDAAAASPAVAGLSWSPMAASCSKSPDAVCGCGRSSPASSRVSFSPRGLAASDFPTAPWSAPPLSLPAGGPSPSCWSAAPPPAHAANSCSSTRREAPRAASSPSRGG